MFRITTSLLAVLVAVVLLCPRTAAQSRPGRRPPATVLDFTVKDIDGKDVRLSRFRGKVLLIVNVASRCGLTPQYAGLQSLYERYRERGFVVLGFPANDFNGQEPGSNEEIKEFCQSNYRVTFPMFSKLSVKGNDQAPLYRFLTSPDTNPRFSGDIEWNFAKFLIGRDGRIAGRFSPRTAPDDPELLAAIEKLLTAKR